MVKWLYRYLLLIAILIFLWQACDRNDPSVDASRLRIKLTDATSLVLKKLYVDIREIEVFLADSTGGEGEWVSLDFSGKTYDLLTLTNGKTVQIVDQYIPAGGELQRIRLLLGEDSRLITNTDSTINLQIPPELQEGVFIDAVSMALRANTISSMVIDLNAALSVRESNGSYFLHPVARAFPETYGGTLRGYVAPIEANPLVVVIQDKDTLFTFPERENPGDDMCMYRFIGLKEGEWEVHLIPLVDSIYSDTLFVKTVELGKTTDITPKPIRLKSL